jgi:SAM-dependent methyltransferase
MSVPFCFVLTMQTLTTTPALAAYEALAPTYDVFTEGHDHDLWLGRLDELINEHGVGGNRLLDVGCGTGKSALPMLRRGYDVTACDLSPGMVAIARDRLGPEADVFVADMRELPDDLGQFDVITCLDDAVNYLTNADDLLATFQSVERVLAPDGLYVFDVNTMLAYRTSFVSDFVAETPDTVFCWRAGQDAAAEPDRNYSAQLDAFVLEEDGRWTRTTSRHEQRHFSDATIRACLADAGLRCVDMIGQAPGVQLSRPVDETVHHKCVYLARLDG